jgi:hypothetical protein
MNRLKTRPRRKTPKRKISDPCSTDTLAAPCITEHAGLSAGDQFPENPPFWIFAEIDIVRGMNSVSEQSREAGRSQATQEKTSRRAQEIWEALGRPSDRDMEIWLRAERELQNSTSCPSEAILTTVSPEPVADTDIQAPPPKPVVKPRKSGRSSKSAG